MIVPIIIVESEELPAREAQANIKEMPQVNTEVELKTAAVHHQETMASTLTCKTSPVRMLPRETKRKSPDIVATREEMKTKLVRQGIPSESKCSFLEV